MYTKTWDLSLPETDISINRRFQRKLQSPDKGPSLEGRILLTSLQGVKILRYCVLIDRGPLAKIISFRSTHLGNTWFMVYLKDIYRYIATKKTSEAKNLPDTEKTGDL